MSSLNVLISHSYEEKELAGAWKKLIESISFGAIEVWFSSDTDAAGGVPLASEWRNDLYRRLASSHIVLAIQTSFSDGRPWIMWECGVASGIKKVRGILPIVYAMERGELANPLNTYQAYKGDDPEQVHEVCTRLAQVAELKLPETVYTQPISVYMDTVRLHLPRKTRRSEQMTAWRNRFEQLVQSGRLNELQTWRDMMYNSFDQPFQPSNSAMHELLCRLLLNQRDYNAALEEANYALQLTPDDVELLHFKAMALVGRHDLSQGKALLEQIIALKPALSMNAEISSLLGRIHREQWQITQKPEELEAAFQAYYRVYRHDPTAYYPGINAAAMALQQGNETTGMQIAKDVLATCWELQGRATVSFWVDFTAGEALLALGEPALALVEYQKGLQRLPAPSERERESAALGVTRMAAARKLADNTIIAIQSLLHELL